MKYGMKLTNFCVYSKLLKGLIQDFIKYFPKNVSSSFFLIAEKYQVDLFTY